MAHFLSAAIARIRDHHLPFLEEMDRDDPEYAYYREDIAALRAILNVFSEYAIGQRPMLTKLPSPIRGVDFQMPIYGVADGR